MSDEKSKLSKLTKTEIKYVNKGCRAKARKHPWTILKRQMSGSRFPNGVAGWGGAQIIPEN